MSKVLPILFNTDMVKAILDGRKTVTRRLIMPHNRKKAKEQGYRPKNGLWVDFSTDNGDKDGHIKDYSISSCWSSFRWYINKYAPYRPGDILYVRETWAFMPCIGCNGEYVRYGVGIPCYDTQAVEYDDGDSISDGCFVYRVDCRTPERVTWRPSIHMPKEAARMFLKVTNVSVERLQDMTQEETVKEGIFFDECPNGFTWKSNTDMKNCYTESMGAMRALWNSTIKKSEIDHYGWDANPWVLVIEFERCEKPEEV